MSHQGYVDEEDMDPEVVWSHCVSEQRGTCLYLRDDADP